VAIGDVPVRGPGVAGWVVLSAPAGASEKTRSDVSDRVPVAAGLIPELGDLVVPASAGTAAEFADPGRAAASACGGAAAARVGAEATAAFGGAEAAGGSPGTRDAGAFGDDESDAPARPTPVRLTLVEIFPARRATTAASTIPAATITMTNIS
jgi:hypothetical protein